jgi:hypothetical protein
MSGLLYDKSIEYLIGWFFWNEVWLLELANYWVGDMVFFSYAKSGFDSLKIFHEIATVLV